MKFRHTLLIILMLFSLVPLYLLGIFMAYENEKSAEAVVTESLTSIGKTQIIDINNFCKAQKEYMELIRQYNVVKDEILVNLGEKEPTGKASLEYLESILKEHVRSNSSIASISIIDADFSVVASSEAYAQGELCDLAGAKEEYLAGKFIMGNLHKREIDGRAYRMVTAYDGIYTDGKLIGYIVEEIYTSHFNQYRNSVDQVVGGKMYIVDAVDEYITVGISKNEQGLPEYTMTKEEKEYYDNKWNSINWKGKTSGVFDYTSGGKKHIAYYSDINYSDWKICINADLSVYKERTEQFRQLLMMVLCILSAVLIIVTMLLTKKLTKPLGRIVSTLTRVRKEHDYSLRVGYRSRDEFGVLAKEVDELLVFAEAAECMEQRKQKSLEKEVEQDPLTGIYNKKAIGNHIEQLLAEGKKGTGIVIGFVDIDNFRDYNTLYGHQAGDEVICFVANTLKKQMGDNVGRNGGDEFLFCLPDTDDKTKAEASIAAFLGKLNEGFYNEKTGKTMGVPCSIGVAMGTVGESTFKSLVEKADEAMYQTKNNGKNGYSIL